MEHLELVSAEYLEAKETFNTDSYELVGTKYDSKGNQFVFVRKKEKVSETF